MYIPINFLSDCHRKEKHFSIFASSISHISPNINPKLHFYGPQKEGFALYYKRDFTFYTSPLYYSHYTLGPCMTYLLGHWIHFYGKWIYYSFHSINIHIRDWLNSDNKSVFLAKNIRIWDFWLRMNKYLLLHHNLCW